MMTRYRQCVISLLLLCGSVGYARASTPDTKPSPAERLSRRPTRAEMKGVRFRIERDTSLDIRYLRGALLRTRRGRAPVFEDKESFSLKLDAAEIGIDAASLGNLLNRHTFAYPGAPLREITVSVEGGKVKQRGILRKGAVETRFELVGELSPTPEGNIRLHPISMKVAGLKAGRLMEALDIKVSDLVALDGSRGVKTEGNDLILYPDKLLPAPKISGRVSAVRIEGSALFLTFGAGQPEHEPGRGNYMRFRGGTLRFGKLTMAETDLRIYDADPKDPFDFYLSDYHKQLVAGFAKILPNQGLRVSMPDYGDVQRGLTTK
jgi:hypothetical protein